MLVLPPTRHKRSDHWMCSLLNHIPSPTSLQRSFDDGVCACVHGLGGEACCVRFVVVVGCGETKLNSSLDCRPLGGEVYVAALG